MGAKGQFPIIAALLLTLNACGESAALSKDISYRSVGRGIFTQCMDWRRQKVDADATRWRRCVTDTLASERAKYKTLEDTLLSAGFECYSATNTLNCAWNRRVRLFGLGFMSADHSRYDDFDEKIFITASGDAIRSLRIEEANIGMDGKISYYTATDESLPLANK